MLSGVRRVVRRRAAEADVARLDDEATSGIRGWASGASSDVQ